MYIRVYVYVYVYVYVSSYHACMQCAYGDGFCMDSIDFVTLNICMYLKLMLIMHLAKFHYHTQ